MDARKTCGQNFELVSFFGRGFHDPILAEEEVRGKPFVLTPSLKNNNLEVV